MKLELNELLKGKATKIKEKEYFQTEAYITPFLERMQKLTSDFRVEVKLPEQVTITKREDLNFDDVTYNRVWIQAVLPEQYCVENHDEVIGMVYGIDTRKPVAKFYRGGLNRACTNLCVFDPSYLSVQEIKSAEALNYRYLDNIIDKANDIMVWLQKLHSITVSRKYEDINESLGRWIRNAMHTKYNNGFTPVKLGVSNVVDAYKLLFEDAKSPYYVSADSGGTDMFNVYNAFTEIISNKDTKDIINKCEKTLLLKDILSI